MLSGQCRQKSEKHQEEHILFRCGKIGDQFGREITTIIEIWDDSMVIIHFTIIDSIGHVGNIKAVIVPICSFL